MTAELSGRDLAREALHQALAAAKQRGTDTTVRQKSKRLRTVKRAGGCEPVGLGNALAELIAARGWQPGSTGGDILQRWPAIVPELAEHVRAEHYDQKRRCLHLRPSSPAFATQLNLFQTQLVQRINTALGSQAVRSLQILRPSVQTRNPATDPAPATRSSVTDRQAAAGPDRWPPNEQLVAARAAARAARAERKAAEEARLDALRSRLGPAAVAREPETAFVEGVRAREEADRQARRAADRALAEARRQSATQPLRTPGAA